MDGFVRQILERGAHHSLTRFYQTNFVRQKMYESLGPILDEALPLYERLLEFAL